MRCRTIVSATAVALLLAAAAPPLASAAGHPPPRVVSSQPALWSVIWNSLRNLLPFLGHKMDPNGLLKTDSGHELDPNGQPSASPDLGHGLDPNG